MWFAVCTSWNGTRNIGPDGSRPSWAWSGKNGVIQICGRPPPGIRTPNGRVEENVTGTVVDDQERLAPTATANNILQKLEEGRAVEDGRELVEKPRAHFECNDAEDVRGLAHPEGVYAGLFADACPRSMKRPVEPEAGVVAERDDATALPRCFFDRWQRFA